MIKSPGQIQKPYEKSTDYINSPWNLIPQDLYDLEYVSLSFMFLSRL